MGLSILAYEKAQRPPRISFYTSHNLLLFLFRYRYNLRIYTRTKQLVVAPLWERVVFFYTKKAPLRDFSNSYIHESNSIRFTRTLELGVIPT